MAEKTRKSLLPTIKHRRIYTEARTNPLKPSKKIIESTSGCGKTENMKVDYLCSVIDRDPILAKRFSKNYRSKTLDGGDGLHEKQGRNIQYPSKGT